MTAPTTQECEALAERLEEYGCDAAAAAALRAVAAERDAKDKRIASMVWTADQMVWRRCDGEGRPQPGHDCRAIVVLHDDEGMCWIGIRAWSGGDGAWLVGGKREESAHVSHWMPLPPMPDAIGEPHPLRAEVEALRATIKRQGRAALTGMNTAQAIGLNAEAHARKMLAESNPAAIESERAANARLTDEIDALRAEVESLREALGTVVYELAALIPKPASPTEPGWPVENPADAKCLQLAYVAARTAIAKAEGRDAT